jgi:hypothetical protein
LRRRERRVQTRSLSLSMLSRVKRHIDYTKYGGGRFKLKMLVDPRKLELHRCLEQS